MDTVIADIWSFIGGWRSNWDYFIGTFLVAALIWFWERHSHRTWVGAMKWPSLILAMVVVSFMAWRDEHYKAVSARKDLEVATEQKLKAEINLVHATSTDGVITITIAATLSNLGPPTTADAFTLRVTTPSGKDLTLVSAMPKHEDWVIKTVNSERKFMVADFLNSKTTLTPIAAGARVQGVLVFQSDKLTMEDLARPRSILTLGFRDIRGARTTLVAYGKGPAGITADLAYLPGVKMECPLPAQALQVK